MKNIKILILSIFLALSFSSCDDFFDVNEPSNVVAEKDQELDLLMPSVEYYAAMLEFDIAYSIGQVQQHIASYYSLGIDQHYDSSIYTAWYEYYAKFLYTLKRMESLAEEKNATHYKGVIKVLDAYALGMVTDIYGDIPYTEASEGSENLQPAVDSQQSIYNDLQLILSEAIADLSATDTSGYENLPGDGIYFGDISKWTRLAYTLKARYALHLAKRNGSETAAQEALLYLSDGFTSNDDDFQLIFNDKVKNPWNTSVVLASNTGNISVLFSEQIVNYMNSTIYPTAAYDPRIYDYIDNGGAPTFDGAQNGNEGSTESGDAANTVFNANSYYFQENSPLVLVSYAEALFIKAEAEFLVNGGSTTSVGSTQEAYDAYLDGIQANMDKIGIDPVLRDAYLNDPVVAVTPSALKLEHIMKEKYVALLLNPEIYNDLRRYDFSTEVYKGLELPANQNPEIAGQWFRRAIYPTSELSSNPNLLASAKTIADPVWWDE